MIGFAVVGVAVNLVAAVLTHRGESLNQKAINLHMLEDVLGWLVVLIGAVVMGFSRFSLLDSLLSVGVALFILVHALKTGKEALDVLLEKAPMDVHRVEQALEEIPQVEAVEHLHLWTLDGIHHLATVHLITAADPASVRTQARQVLSGLGIGHATLEVAGPEDRGQSCPIPSCTHHHHHHHHH
jgi:cobalt-zinc-cadmium efflux system protein